MRYLPFRKHVVIGETEFTVYSISWLARLSQRHPATLRKWERNGVLPKPILEKCVDGDVRYYTAGELLGFTRIIRATKFETGKAFPIKFKQQLAEFSTKLRQQLQASPDKVLAALPEEDRMYKAMMEGQQSLHSQKRYAGVLLSAMNIPTEKVKHI